eukprot:CAMPEP_0203682998 /NCGR_PEP_ID=MMETSP0090-20130426/47292_1 /ASSEMBLY_ACC=CAM_ASM_001088 /TAXON_ID=426623 /ORGANISM="Chaetoceros affinis, Strain CCMP159" /LENGTH=222 /DNA_ID=CAMNT_0050552119 /DNA_START=1352 /DNA_END=2020 /DNA_ORIENTATION=-
MTRLALSLFVAAAASLPSAFGAHMGQTGSRFFNFRSSADYSSVNTLEALTTPGAEFYISPKDSFDFVPSAGYGAYEDAEKTAAYIQASSDHGDLHAAVVKGSSHEVLTKWAVDADMETLKKYQVPRPNESLPGKVLTVKSAEALFTAEGVCHEFERETFYCHKPHAIISVFEVIVSPDERTSKLWVACHGNDDCHVMNAGDFVFSAGNNFKVLGEKLLRGSL